MSYIRRHRHHIISVTQDGLMDEAIEDRNCSGRKAIINLNDII